MSLRASPRRELASCQALFSRAAIFANSKHSEPWAPNWVNAVNAVEFAGLCMEASSQHAQCLTARGERHLCLRPPYSPGLGHHAPVKGDAGLSICGVMVYKSCRREWTDEEWWGNFRVIVKGKHPQMQQRASM
ncbi:unnamed protein product, partial [Effrenium voratum]